MSNGSATPERRLLRSWKAIAAHLQVDVRTVQRWEAKTDIPIYRHGNEAAKRTHPTAYTDELDEWLTQYRTRERPRPSPAGRALPGRRTLLAVAALGVVVATVGSGWYFTRPAVPAYAEVGHGRLRVFDLAGRRCWEVDIPESSAPTGTGLGELGSVATLVEDVDADGRNEVLLNIRPPATSGRTGRLFCFDHRGRERWQVAYGRPRRWGDRDFTAQYVGNFIRTARVDGKGYLLVGAGHVLWFPSHLLLIDATSGRIADEYWHPGALVTGLVHDLDGDGRDELLAGGINNPGQGLGRPALVVLGLPFSRHVATERGDMAGFSGGHERSYALFPRPDVCSVNGDLPFVNEIAVEGSRLRVRATCGQAALFYSLDFRLQLLDLRIADTFFPFHARLERDGQLDHPFRPAEEECLRRIALFPTAVDGNSSKLAAFWTGCE